MQKNNLINSRTEYNLMMAFTAESRSFIRYKTLGTLALLEGKEMEANKFYSLANDSRGNAFRMLRYMIDKGKDPVTGFECKTSDDRYKIALTSQQHMAEDVYPGMAEECRNEGFEEVANMFAEMAKICNNHVINLENNNENTIRERSY